MPILPDNLMLDVHDFAAIVLDAHARIDPPFRTDKLVEVNRGDSPVQLFQRYPGYMPPEWEAFQDDKRVAYILNPLCASPTTVDINTFAAPRGVITPGGTHLTRQELEDAFWRCKTFDNGFLLADLAKCVLESLPRTTRLRARTSTGYELICRPQDVRVQELLISPHESCYISEYSQHTTQYKEHFSGFGEKIRWAALLLGDPLKAEERVVLDLAITQIGGRGLGGELFALERKQEYLDKLLPAYATRDAQHDKETYMFNPLSYSETRMKRQGPLTDHVADRLDKLAQGEVEFCGYCGKDDVQTRCSKCEQAYFCESCVRQGWKYHKAWCS